MISLEKTRQSLKSLNLAVIIVNIIFAAITVLLVALAAFGFSAMNNPEYQAQIQSQLTPEQLAAIQNSNPALELAATGLVALAYLVVFVLAFLNRKKIDANQPSLLPYYVGIGGVIYNFLTYVIQGTAPTIFAIIVQGGLLALYIFSIQKAKLLLNNSTSNADIS